MNEFQLVRERVSVCSTMLYVRAYSNKGKAAKATAPPTAHSTQHVSESKDSSCNERKFTLIHLFSVFMPYIYESKALCLYRRLYRLLVPIEFSFSLCLCPPIRASIKYALYLMNRYMVSFHPYSIHNKSYMLWQSHATNWMWKKNMCRILHTHTELVALMFVVRRDKEYYANNLH